MNQTPLATLGPVTYQHITAAGTVVVKTAPGALLSININGVSAASTVDFLDQTGTAVGTVGIGLLTLGTAYAAPNVVNFGPPAAGLAFNSGLVIVTTGTADLTIGYR